ncbi:MAG TPA: urease accessory protein UreF [Candidatus Binataceae bacterium]|nr:urease accessory protein UreF [Candidatus Binataceae bacterium]
MTPDTTLSLLQFADGLFPAGAYAHSFGLEAYVARGAVVDADDVERMLRAYLQGSAGPTDACAMVNASRAAADQNLDQCLQLDAVIDAMKAPSELRDASRQMGRQTARIAAALIDHPTLRQFARLADEDSTPCHHCVIFGIAGGAQGWPPHDAAAAYLYSTSAAIVGAALRLLPLGQLKGQLIIRNLAPLIAALAREVTVKTAAQFECFAPGIEISSMRHAAMDGRLFRS